MIDKPPKDYKELSSNPEKFYPERIAEGVKLLTDTIHPETYGIEELIINIKAMVSVAYWQGRTNESRKKTDALKKIVEQIEKTTDDTVDTNNSEYHL